MQRGKLKRCKTRLILQGNRLTQGEDGDFLDSFAPVSSATAVRTFISIAAADDLHLHSIDLEQAFIQGSWNALPEGAPTIYIQPPWGWDEEEGVVYELLRPLYGHPAAARALHYTLHGWLKSKGFEKSGFEESVWVRPAGGEYQHPIRLTAHVDDTLIAVRCLRTMQQFKRDLLERFEGTDEGEVQCYLGCELKRDWARHSITITQASYAKKILMYFGYVDKSPVATPLPPGKRLRSRTQYPEYADTKCDPSEHKWYRKVLGYFSYLVQLTRADLAFGYAELSKHAADPCEKHFAYARHLLQFLAGSWEEGATYSRPAPDRRHLLFGWVDSDYASCPVTRRSHTGYVLYLNNGPIAWKSKQQACVTLSSAEAEYIAASQCAQTVLYIRHLLRYLGYEQLTRTVLFEDNEACIKMSRNPVNPDAAKHIDTRMYRLRELVQDKLIWLEKTPTHLNVADALTKSLSSPAFHTHREYLRGCTIPFQPESEYLRQHPDVIKTFPVDDVSRKGSSRKQMCVG